LQKHFTLPYLYEGKEIKIANEPSIRKGNGFDIRVIYFIGLDSDPKAVRRRGRRKPEKKKGVCDFIGMRRSTTERGGVGISGMSPGAAADKKRGGKEKGR